MVNDKAVGNFNEQWRTTAFKLFALESSNYACVHCFKKKKSTRKWGKKRKEVNGVEIRACTSLRDYFYQEYMKGRVCNSWFFALDAATAEYKVRHRWQRQSALKKETLLSSSIELNVEHCKLTNACMQRVGPARTASRIDRAFIEREHAHVQRWVHNDLKREWLWVIDDALEILPWLTLSKYEVAYSSSSVLLLLRWWHSSYVVTL